MRIDLNPSSMPELERSRGGSTASTSPGGAVENSTQSADTASLSTGHEAIGILSTHVRAVPDIRQALVASLREAVNSGTYRISPDGIADKMIADRVL